MIIWQLELGNEIIAKLAEEESNDWPWINARLLDSVNFERFRVFFSDEDAWPETQEFEDLCAEIRIKGNFVMRNMETNTSYKNLRLNHDGDFVWFRVS
jgi:hypothetical protein